MRRSIKKHILKRSNFHYILTAAVFVFTFFLGIGYAQISGIDLSVDGVASMSEQSGIIISDIHYSNDNNAILSESKINTYYQTLLDSKNTLGDTLDSYITYEVTITNLTDENVIFDKVVYSSEFYDNEDIIFELTNLQHGDLLEAHEAVTFQITFKYKTDLTEVTNNVLNSYLNFKFKMENGVIITFDSNGGTSVNSMELISGNPIGELPTSTKEICENPEESTLELKNCSYVGRLEGWYLESTFETKVDENYIVTEDITLHAKWVSTYEKYEKLGETVFDGTSLTFIDTGINVYSEENIDKDFDIEFDLISVDSTTNTQPTILNAKNEAHSSYPGFVVRLNTNNTAKSFINARWNNAQQTLNSNNGTNLPIHIEIKRRSGVVSASMTGQNQSVSETVLYNQANWQLNTPHPKNISLGGIYNSSGNPDRFFKGTLQNVSIVIHDN